MGFVGGIGGLVNGLAAIVGFVGGIGGLVNGLAATVGFVGGIGGSVNGLAATVGFVGGIGGSVNGLATARLATATIPAAKTKARTFSELAVMNLRSLITVGTMQVKSNPKVS